MHVLIVGGGLGGLALAQCLRKKGISFEVFERDAGEDARFQGWAIALHSILDELAEAFPDDVPSLATSNHLLPLTLNAQIGLYFPGMGGRLGVEDTPEMPIIRAERSRLRKILATNIPVQWSKRVSRIEYDDKGVEAFFEDGTSAKGDVLIGADGINSSVRTHLLKKSGSELLKTVPIAAIVGEVTLEGGAFQRQLELGHSAYIYQSPELGFMNFCGLHHTMPNGISGRHYWMFMQQDMEVAQPDHWLQTATQQEKLNHVLKAAAKMPSRFRELFELTPAAGIKREPHLWKVLEMDVELGTLPAERVILLGDAVHPMTPFRGEGGYHTLVDAMLLSRTLDNIRDQDFATMKAAIAEYNAEMVERGSDAVRTSRSVQSTQKTREGQSKYVSARQDAKPMPWEKIELVEITA